MIETPNAEALLSDLNDSQKQAVMYCDGPSLVIAGAGSGKTRVLTYKIAYLLQQGYKPWNILALTFTNKAAREMQSRIANLVGPSLANHLLMGTFHSIFARILRAEARHLGYEPSFTIYDESDSRSLIKAIVKELKLDDKVYKPATISGRISMAKNHLIQAKDYPRHVELIERDKSTNTHATYHIYEIYQERLQQANAMDFDNLLVNTWKLFSQFEDIRRKYCDRIHFVLVDEYQDTNYVQQQIVWLLTKENQHVCVVGDDAQSIYSFRGANIDNILDFNNLYKGSKLFKLEQNYRSTQVIVKAANSLIKHNNRQIDKDVYSKNEQGEKLRLRQVSSDREEAMVVCREITKIKHDDHGDWNDFAILYRTNAQSRAFEDEMRKQGIPYRIYGGMSFYQRKEIKDILAYFRLVCNPDDEEAFKRIINYPARGIGQTTLQKIIDCAQTHNVSLWRVISQPVVFDFKLTKATAQKIQNFHDLIQSFIDETDKDARTIGQDIIRRSGIWAELSGKHDIEGVERMQNLEEFTNSLQEFVEDKREEGRMEEIFLTDFLQNVSLMTDLDSDDDKDAKRVSLMTIHSAKGLEFPTVFVVGLEENIFPSPMCQNNPRELEEERRLLYVAITRAEKYCYLTCAESRYRYGKMEFSNPSRFINDIASEFVSGGGGSSIRQKEYRSYGSMGGFGSDRHPGIGRGMQNEHPVGFQFMADPQRKITGGLEKEYGDKLYEKPLREKMKEKGFKALGAAQLKSVAPRSDMSEIKEGSVIKHQRFGIGKVIKIDGTGENRKATVDFESTGRKQLLLKFARFIVIS